MENNQITRKNKIIISAVSVMVLFGLYIVFDKGGDKTGSQGKTAEVASTTPNAETNVKYTLEKIDNKTQSYTVPDLDRQVVISPFAKFLPDDMSAVVKGVKDSQNLLKKNPSNFLQWLDLGLNQKSAGDYDGAIISWEYASKINPSDHIALGNIANLYAFNIRNVSKAEEYYKKAISRAPREAYLYTQLSEVYRDISGDKKKALDIINQGLSKIPNDPNLLEAKMGL